MLYTLKYKDINLAAFEIRGKGVTECYIDKSVITLLPLPLKRLIKDGYKEEFVESEDDISYELNEEGCSLFDEWLSDREIPITRDNYQKYIENGKNARQWMFENNGLSFNDSFWFESEYEELQWSDIVDKLHQLDTFYQVKGCEIYPGHNATLGGQLEKYWFQERDIVKLCKKHVPQMDILSAREIIATLIYREQGYENYCHYHFAYHRNGDIAGCVCDLFTNENTQLISAYDLLSEYNMTQVDDVWEKIIDLAAKYGLDKQITSDYLDIQTMVDFLITNRDRHQRNIAFLQDTITHQLVSPAPIFDNGSSSHYEGLLPESLYNTTVNGLYHTEMECLSHVKNFSLIDIDKLPNRQEISNLLDKCGHLRQRRKKFLLDMYEQKKGLLRELQQQYLLGNDTKTYIEQLVRQQQEKCNNIDDIIFQEK